MSDEQTPQRVITTHDASAASIFDTSVPTTVPVVEFPSGLATFSTQHATEGFPVSLSANTDIQIYCNHLANPGGIVINNGTIMRTIVMKPGGLSHMHRTISVDTGVVIDGSLELLLDSGESRILRKGDVFVQRATMHMWKNTSSTEPATMVVFTQPCAPLEVAGKLLEEDIAFEGKTTVTAYCTLALVRGMEAGMSMSSLRQYAHSGQE
ncbi:cupin domain-containing protein [Histoplasma capsulatum H143]|uniref:Cupin domain-containing protein n=1 Tax=Ajellomyces capsulatus (strain H143) TaxID=544712 RepID=C6HNY0_AJECH|nr:cupin domain-containing protein [Histoplasma capsulatum H143]